LGFLGAWADYPKGGLGGVKHSGWLQASRDSLRIIKHIFGVPVKFFVKAGKLIAIVVSGKFL